VIEVWADQPFGYRRCRHYRIAVGGSIGDARRTGCLRAEENMASVNLVVSRLLLVAALVLGMTAISHAQELGGLQNGTIVSASAPVSNSTVTVFTTPANKQLVLTQVCFGLDGQGIILGKKFGFVTEFSSSATQATNCTSFSPGYLLPVREILQCVSGGNSFCSISGVLVPAQ
jgi:hypothetical protein